MIVALSLDRLDAIVRPMKFIERRRRAKFLALAAWTFSALFSIPYLFTKRVRDFNGISACRLDEWVAATSKILISVVTLVVMIIPSIVMAACSAVIVHVIRRNNKVTLRPSNQDACDEGLRHHVSAHPFQHSLAETARTMILTNFDRIEFKPSNSRYSNRKIRGIKTVFFIVVGECSYSAGPHTLLSTYCKSTE